MLRKNTAKIAAVICLLLMFLLSGVNKMMHFGTTVQSLVSKAPWWPLPSVSIVITILLEVICPLIIVYTMLTSEFTMASKLSVLALIVFTITVTLVYHPLRLNSTYMKNIPFLSNLSLVGGLGLLSLSL